MTVATNHRSRPLAAGLVPRFRSRARIRWTNLVVRASRLHRENAGGTPAPQMEIEQLISARLLNARTIVLRVAAAIALVAFGALSRDGLLAAQRDVLPPRAATASTSSDIRRLSGKHITISTDLASSSAVDELPAVFDRAFPLYCAYFGVDPARYATWRAAARIMKDKAAFIRRGLLPANIRPFDNGFSHNFDLWICDQPSDYYRRHLLLHEGVHSFMNTVLGDSGPAWYSEGMAELLGTHRWKDGQLTLGYFPANRDDVPMWGRIKIIRDAYAARRARRLADVLAYDPATQPGTEPYAWCWAAAAFFDGHPRYQATFRKLGQSVSSRNFNEHFRRLLGPEWSHAVEEWQLFIRDLEYGYDLTRTAIDFTAGQALAPSGARVMIRADRGWQNTGVRLDSETVYRLEATGRYQVADKPQIWWSEPGGVSIRYYRGRPLGMLMAVVRPDSPAPGPSPWINPIAIGLESELTPKRAGTLFLRINDSGAELGDNAGELSIQVNVDTASKSNKEEGR